MGKKKGGTILKKNFHFIDKGLSLFTTICFIFLLFLGNSPASKIRAQDKREKIDFDKVQLFLQANPAESQKLIEDLSEQEMIEISSQIRFLARKKTPDIDKLYFILQSLEQKKANQLAQERLNHLLSVIFLTLVLFLGFLGYVLLQQRKIFRNISNIEK